MKTLFLSVGDASGDEHCALLVRELLQRHPDWKIFALAGPRCAQAGAHIIGSTQGLGVIGFTSALAMVPRSWRLKEQAFRWLESNKPDAAIFCDWGGFNTRILPKFQQLSVPVLYYFPPRSWQKGGDAGTQIAPLVDCVATPFEWSAQKLQRAGARARWVGHPILEKVAALPSREELRDKFEFYPDDVVVALLAGSRDMEINSIAPHLARAIKSLYMTPRPGPQRFRFVFATPPGGGPKIDRYLRDLQDIVMDDPVEGQTLELLRAADIGIVKSGTSTLEAAALNLPQIVVYDAPAALHWQVNLTGLRRKIPFIGMPNIILDRMACPELLGENCRAPKIADAVLDLLDSPDKVTAMREDYALVRRALGEELPHGATQLTANMVEEMLDIQLNTEDTEKQR
jgi:lipid-A-disaccharide synthase